jgi:hypothetical protein
LRWRSASPEALAWREYEDEVVVRNVHTGSTHLLNAVSAAILRELTQADHPLAAAEIAARLADNVDEAWMRSIEEILVEFQRLGLAQAEGG